MTGWPHRVRLFVGIVAVLVLVLSATTFVVREGQAALVTRVGRPLAVMQDAGLHWKLPWPIDEAVPIDLRRRVFRGGYSEMLTRDKKNIVMLSYAVWKVTDPLLFHQAVGSVESAEVKLDGLITNAAIGVLGRYDLSAIVSTDPATLRLDTIQDELLDKTVGLASERYGVTIERVAFERVSLPEENTASVFEQMRAERRQFAAEFTAEGERRAAEIKSAANLEAARIRAEGAEEAAKIQGQAEAEAARIYAEAHNVDPELYRFLRSLETIDEVVGDQTTVILRTDSEPFRLLERSQ
ncbi:MAG: protease modulator HflC [Myxococcota bacterium]